MLRLIKKYILGIMTVVALVAVGIGACQINKSMVRQHEWGGYPSDTILE